MLAIYQHYSGKYYMRLGTALHSENLEPLEVYRCLYNNPKNQLWVRPRDMFHEVLESGTPRFTPVGRVRRALGRELEETAHFGFDAWGTGVASGEYLSSFLAERDFVRGQWYLIENAEGEVCSVLNTLRFLPQLVGIASVATKPEQREKGFACLLIRAVMELLRVEDPAMQFALFAEVSPSFFQQFGFRELPVDVQRFRPAVAMITGDEPVSDEVAAVFREYF